MNSYAIPPIAPHPPGLTAIGVFLLFGSGMASLAGTSLVWRGTALDRIWVLNPSAYVELAPFGKKMGILFLLLAGALALSSVGWFKRRRWGWQLAVVIIATQVLGDFVNVSLGHIVQGGIGVAIAGALLFYMTRRNVRTAFGSDQGNAGG